MAKITKSLERCWKNTYPFDTANHPQELPGGFPGDLVAEVKVKMVLLDKKGMLIVI